MAPTNSSLKTHTGHGHKGGGGGGGGRRGEKDSRTPGGRLREKSGGVGNSSEAGAGTGETLPPGFYKQHRRGRHPSSADRRNARTGRAAGVAAQVSASATARPEDSDDLELCALGIATPMPVAQSETEVGHFPFFFHVIKYPLSPHMPLSPYKESSRYRTGLFGVKHARSRK